MTLAQSFHEFWSGFGWKAYERNTVPSEDLHPEMPRITYEVMWSQFDDPRQIMVSLWDRSYSWESVEQKAEEIATSIGGGSNLPDNKGKVFFLSAERMSDPDDSIRRVIIQVLVDYYRSI